MARKCAEGLAAGITAALGAGNDALRLCVTRRRFTPPLDLVRGLILRRIVELHEAQSMPVGVWELDLRRKRVLRQPWKRCHRGGKHQAERQPHGRGGGGGMVSCQKWLSPEKGGGGLPLRFSADDGTPAIGLDMATTQ